jgi:branched-chain amino acid transport system permease protein
MAGRVKPAGPLDHHVLLTRHRFAAVEALPWLLALGALWVFPSYLTLGSQILIMILFAMSLDLILGYAGIVSLGHAAFFGAGAYTAGILSAKLGWSEPLTGLAAAAAVAALVGAISGWFILRTRGLTLLMLTLATTIMLKEIANQWEGLTGGDNGLQGISIDPILGQFEFDLYGQTAFVYCLAVLFLLFLFARALIYSPFGQSLRGIRENQLRMPAIGAPVPRQLLAIYTISAAMAGVAGALLAQTTEFVALQTLSFERSGDVLIILILGGTGRLYGAFLGSAVYMLLQDQLAKTSPTYWLFGLGLVLVLVVLFARRGLLGLLEDAWQKIWRKR